MKLKRILIIDDSVSARAFLAGLLTERYRLKPDQIKMVGSGEDAVILLAKYQYDLIFLDLYMPNMTGFETLSAIRAGGITTPIVITSSEDHDHAYETALRQGATGYLVKPIELEDLESKLKGIFGANLV